MNSYDETHQNTDGFDTSCIIKICINLFGFEIYWIYVIFILYAKSSIDRWTYIVGSG
jgi:hypothetical protein